MSGMPNKACPFPGTAKKLHIFLVIVFYFYFAYAQLFYCWSIVHFNWMSLFLVATNCSSVVIGNNFLYMCKGIMFLSLPVSTLYSTIFQTWFNDVFRIAVINEHLLLKLIEFIYTMSK